MVNKEFADAFATVAPKLKSLFGKDLMVAVTDREKFITYVKGDIIDAKVSIGDKIPAGDPMNNCMKENKETNVKIGSELYGIPFNGTYMPIGNENGEVIGCLGIAISTELEDSVKNVIETLDESLEQVSSAINAIAVASGTINQNEHTVEETVLAVSSSSNKINDVLVLIKDISDQTRMLGLNASIEAARAGENGRGFGVVAEEIRKLSDESKQTTGIIKELTLEIEKSINSAVAQSKYTFKASEEQAAATEEVNASIEEIISMTNQLRNMAATL